MAAAEEVPIAVTGEIERDPVQPRRQGRIAAESGEAPVGADECVLRDFLGVRPVAQD